MRWLIAAVAASGILGAAVTLFVEPPENADAQAGLPVRAVVPIVARDEPLPATATPTSAPPTATPTLPPATATPIPDGTGSGVVPFGSFLWKDSIDFYHVTGLVKNNLSVPVEFVNVTTNFYNAAGTLIWTDTTFTSLRAIPAGGTSPFEALILEDLEGMGYARGEVVVTDYDTDIFYAIPTGLNVTITNTTIDSIGFGHIIGTVTNSSNATWDFVDVYVAGVNAQGQVIFVDSDFTAPRTLAPGQTGSFEVLVLPHSGFDPVSFSGLQLRAFVDGDEP